MRNKRNETNRFWILSAVLHLLAFVVFFLTPAGQRVFEPKDRSAKAEIIRKDEDLADVVDDIRALAIGRLREQVITIEGVSVRMEQGVETTSRSYQTFQSRQLASAGKRFIEAANQTLQLQKKLLGEIRAFTESEAPDAGELNEVFTSSRGELVDGQEELHRILLLGAAETPEPRSLLEQIEKDQYRVFGLIPDAVKARGREVRALRAIEELEAEKTELEPHVEANVEGYETYRVQIEPADEDRISKMMTRRRAEARVKNLEESLRKKEAAGGDAEKVREDLKVAQAALKERWSIFNDATDHYEEVLATAREFRKNIERQEKRLPYIADRIPELEKAIPGFRSEYRSKSSDALKLQESVVDNQQKLNAMMLKLLRENPDVPVADAPTKEATR
ncbi:MAG: hypothetical protein WD708_02065 [Kiritimatiellia bacterium]